MLENEKIIWDYLLSKIGNPMGVAGLMGNLKAESSFNPHNLNNTANKKLGMTDDQYTEAVDSGKYTKFINDGYDYGLAQWVYSSRKKGLLTLANKQKKSVGDLQLQLEYIWQELQAYSAVLRTLRNATTIKEASDDVLIRYEKPANQGESVKEKRLKYAEEIYNKYMASDDNGEEQAVAKVVKKVVVTAKTVNVRLGDSINYPVEDIVKLGETFDVVAVSQDSGWYAIRCKDKVLWITPYYVKQVD